MTEPKEKTFDDWFFGIYGTGNVGMVAEYFYEDVVAQYDERTKLRIMREWLVAAYLAGKKHRE